MIERYTLPRMAEVWSDRRRFELWLKIEVLACEAWAELGRVPPEALPKIRQASFDLARIQEVEAQVGHDVIAFLTSVNESIGLPEARYVHLGMTSSDVIDTAQALQLRAAAELILTGLEGVRGAALELALKHRRTLMVGRTHGIHAEPITFGFKVAGWVAELDRTLVRVRTAAAEVSVGKLSGPVGSHATLDPQVEQYVCDKLGLAVDAVSTQIVSRDRYAAFVNALALAAASMERIALEIRHLQRSEVGEAFEPFGEQQKGSSAMPHKRNPVLTERICGLARVVRGYALSELENVAVWHERDISHSSAERIVLPDACCLVDFMAQQLEVVLAGLEVRPERMLANLNLCGGVVYSQRVMLALVEAGMAREDAYRRVQKAALDAMRGEGGFKNNLEEDAVVMKLIGGGLEEIFQPDLYLVHLDLAFDRLGLALEAR
ncbi:MAG: adenylosuccinate lyase [Candidatus Dormibacteraceae bacterium]